MAARTRRQKEGAIREARLQQRISATMYKELSSCRRQCLAMHEQLVQERKDLEVEQLDIRFAHSAICCPSSA